MILIIYIIGYVENSIEKNIFKFEIYDINKVVDAEHISDNINQRLKQILN